MTYRKHTMRFILLTALLSAALALNACGETQELPGPGSDGQQIGPDGGSSTGGDGATAGDGAGGGDGTWVNTDAKKPSNAPPVCDPECWDFYDFNCVKVKQPNGAEFCRECTDNTHCTGNPRYSGPTCNTADNMCICNTNADCSVQTVGSLCKLVGNYMMCTCDTDADCRVPPYTLCTGDLIKKCRKPCETNEDCEEGGFWGFCNVETGICEYDDYY
jgi:hypothetical protein